MPGASEIRISEVSFPSKQCEPASAVAEISTSLVRANMYYYVGIVRDLDESDATRFASSSLKSVP